jgi:hypothetical protein
MFPLMDAEEYKWRPYPADAQTARAKLVNGLFDVRATTTVAANLANEQGDNGALKELCGALKQLLEVLGDTFLYSDDALLREDPPVVGGSSLGKGG